MPAGMQRSRPLFYLVELLLLLLLTRPIILVFLGTAERKPHALRGAILPKDSHGISGANLAMPIGWLGRQDVDVPYL